MRTSGTKSGHFQIGTRLCMTLLVVLGIAAIAAPVSAWSKDKLRIGITGTGSDIAFLLADSKGFFAEEGIEHEFIPFASATQMVAPLSTGELDIGAGAPGAGLYNATMRNIGIKIVADKGSMSKGHGYLSLVVRKDLVDAGKVKSLADLKGLKIGDLSRHGSGDVTLNEIMKKGGLKFGDVDTFYMGSAQLSVAMTNKALDATLITEPNLSILVASGQAVLFARSDEIYPNQQLAVVLFSENLIKNKKDIAQRFTNAYAKAARVYNDALQEGRLTGPGSDEIINLLVARTGVKDPALYRSMITPGINPDCHVNKDGLRKDFVFYRQMGWVESGENPDSAIDDSFCANAIAKLGPYRGGK
jgi:NitT/TauT family transport system substrate-binding protein